MCTSLSADPAKSLIIGSDCFCVHSWNNYYKLGNAVWAESPEFPWGVWNENWEDDSEKKSGLSYQRSIDR